MSLDAEDGIILLLLSNLIYTNEETLLIFSYLHLARLIREIYSYVSI